MRNDLIKYEDYLKFKMGIKDNTLDEFFKDVTKQIQKATGDETDFKYIMQMDEKYDPDGIAERYILSVKTTSKKIKDYFEKTGPYILYIKKP